MLYALLGYVMIAVCRLSSRSIAIIAGILLCVITGAGIMLYYRKGDLGDEDRDE